MVDQILSSLSPRYCDGRRMADRRLGLRSLQLPRGSQGLEAVLGRFDRYSPFSWLRLILVPVVGLDSRPNFPVVLLQFGFAPEVSEDVKMKSKIRRLSPALPDQHSGYAPA
jgi:hypothetical protein